jgi:hypothetical protein
MALPDKFDPFVEGAPCAVITRLAAEWMLDEESLQRLFQEHAQTQYEREITLANLVNVMLEVATGTRRSTRASFQARQEEIAASLTALYGKLNRTEPGLGQALVEHSAGHAAQLIRQMRGMSAEPIKGFRTLIVDGNMLAGTDHRLRPVRGTRAAALPGKSLAVYESATGLVVQTILWEDAHSQERALLPSLKIEAGTHLVMDRNFCVTWFLFRVDQSRAYFTVRHHRGSLPLESMEHVGKQRYCGRCESGRVYEQQVRLVFQGVERLFRKIVLKLDTPTRDGETEIVLLSNLPARVPALKIAMTYRERWTIEKHFQLLTDWLNCEVPTLAHPRAALFAFAMSLVAGNLLAVVIASIRAKHGEDAANNLSYCELVDEVAGAYRGMMLALPPSRWTFIQGLTAAQVARLLKSVAGYVDVDRMRKTVRGPKKPRRTPNCKNIRHVSTYRELQKQQEKSC